MSGNKKYYRVSQIEGRYWQIEERWEGGRKRGPFDSKEDAIESEEKIAREKGYFDDLILIKPHFLSFRSDNPWTTFVYCVFIVLVVWGVNLWYTFQPSTKESWEKLELDLSTGEAIMMMCFILGIMTVLSLFPVIMYISCTLIDWYNARLRTQKELERYHIWEELKGEVEGSFATAFHVETYRLPLILVTIAMVVGWVLFFFSGGPDAMWKLADSRNISNFFVDLQNVHPVIFGFLGAFFFSLRTLTHRFFTADLKASVFMHIAVHIWIVMILTLVLSVVWTTISSQESGPEWGLLAICFIAGIIPEVALDLIQKTCKTFLGRFRVVSDTDMPLTKIQGLNVWHQARLAEEGIDNVQNLAESDITSLLANTRLGVTRLLDWIDQALLCIHVGEDFDRYCKAGIHTATEFNSVCKERENPTQKISVVLEKLVKAFPKKEENKNKVKEEEELKKAKIDAEQASKEKARLEKEAVKEKVQQEAEESRKTKVADEKEDIEELKERVFNQWISIIYDSNFKKICELQAKIEKGKKEREEEKKK